MIAQLLPESRYFVYAEVGERSRNTADAVCGRRTVPSKSEHFNMATVNGRDEVYPALAKLFQKEQPVA